MPLRGRIASQKLLSFEFADSFCNQFRASRYIMGLNRSSELIVIAICIFYEHPFSITSVSLYYGTQSHIRVDNYYCLHFLRASIFNFEHLGILRDSIKNLSQNLFSFDFVRSFCIQFRASRYITGLNRTSQEKVIVNWICSEILFSISRVLIYEGIQSDIRVNSYGHLNLLRVTVPNFVRLDILQDSIGLSSKKLSSFEFVESFYIQFRASWNIKGVN